ncbi:DUF3152 domain-containing protein [Streptomyces sp. NPDC006458]|uniref:DUF3152 domain-containing protein n=1 Tax=Streptomyces sp. NPDC006458 TaxID=3154302 RepID=UPI0033AEC65A
MGRHSRRGPAPKGDGARRILGGSRSAEGPGAPQEARPAEGPRAAGDPRLPSGDPRVPGVPSPEQVRAWQSAGRPPGFGGQGPVQGAPRFDGTPAHGVPRFADGTPARGMPRAPDGTPAHGVPRLPDGTPARGVPRLPDGTPAHGVPRFPDGTPAHGVPRASDGTPTRGVPRFPDGTPAHGVPRLPDGTPAHGTPLFDGTPAHGTPQVRGGHPEQRETGGGWGELRGAAAAGAGAATALPRQRQAPPVGPRQDYVSAFDEGGSVPGRRKTSADEDPYAFVTQWDTRPPAGTDDDQQPVRKVGKGKAFTGIAAAAVTTVLAVVVTAQVTERGEESNVGAQSAAGPDRGVHDSASRGDGRPTPGTPPRVVPLTYEQKMGEKYALAPSLAGPGKFDAIPGIDKAPGKGQKFTYRVDVEQGLGLDGELFAQAVYKTLNDERSWAHGGGRTFERIHSGEPDFVITLASPGTTADWCAKSGLDTTEDNVSCDSASTERVMINAYRWAQGSKTYGDEIHAYRQMLINHEVGHRLGFHHVTCDKDGDLAPVMQQQTKFLDHDGVHCRPNPWAYPKS